MPSITDPNKDDKATLRPLQRRRILYPMLPAILDDDSLAVVSTLESEELALAARQGLSRDQYLHALYLKAVAALGHSHFQPKDLPGGWQRFARKWAIWNHSNMCRYVKPARLTF
jgi:hypothetical protein